LRPAGREEQIERKTDIGDEKSEEAAAGAWMRKLLKRLKRWSPRRRNAAASGVWKFVRREEELRGLIGALKKGTKFSTEINSRSNGDGGARLG